MPDPSSSRSGSTLTQADGKQISELGASWQAPFTIEWIAITPALIGIGGYASPDPRCRQHSGAPPDAYRHFSFRISPGIAALSVLPISQPPGLLRRGRHPVWRILPPVNERPPEHRRDRRDG